MHPEGLTGKEDAVGPAGRESYWLCFPHPAVPLYVTGAAQARRG